MLFKNKSSSANQSGRSMIEMLGVLAIIGVLSAGGIAGYTMAMATFKTNKAMDMIQIVSAQAKQIYNSDYTGISAANMFKLGYLSSEYIKPGTANTAAPVGWSPFGTEVTIAQSAHDVGQGTFTISVPDVPTASCVKLVQSYWGDTTFFVRLKVGTTEAVNASSPLTNANAAITACSADKQTMTWEFK